MKSIVLLAFVATAVVGAASASSSTRAVEGIISCGSSEHLVDIRITGCTRAPCEALVGNSLRIEADFRASGNHRALSLQIRLIHGGEGHEIIDGEVPDSAVEQGVTYTFGYTIQITGAFLGPANLAYRVFSAEVGHDEFCVLVPLNVVNRP